MMLVHSELVYFTCLETQIKLILNKLKGQIQVIQVSGL